MSGVKDGLVWWWDLNAADATITDQHSGLVLTRIGTTTVVAGGAPDGGDCVSMGDRAGKYRNTSVPKTVAYENGFSANVWAYSTDSSTVGNWLLNHRNDLVSPPNNQYWQVVARMSVGDGADIASAVPTYRSVSSGVPAGALNQWIMLTLVDTGTESRFYRNGVLVATSTTALGARATGPAAFALGGSAWDSGLGTFTSHRGRMSMAGVWDRPLTADEITWLFNSGSGRRYNALTYGERDLGGEVLWICPSLDDIGAGTLVARDLTTNRNHGILTNMDVGDWVSDTANGGVRSLDFDGVNDYLTVTDAASLDVTGAITLCAWIKSNGNYGTGGKGILSKYETASNQRSYALVLNASGNVQFAVSQDGTSANVRGEWGSTVVGTNWRHVAATYVPSTGTVAIYVDGVAESRSNNGGPLPSSIFAGSAPLWVGVVSTLGSDLFFDGRIDDARVFNRALTQTEITALASQRGYQRPAVNGIGGELAWWCPSLDTFGNGTLLARDLANQRYHGTLNNMNAATDWPNDTVSGGVRAVDLNTTTAMINNPGFAATNQFPLSISVWILQRQISPIARWVTLANNDTFVVRQSNGDRIHGYYIDAASQLIQLFAALGTVVLNQWAHIALTCDGSTLRIYRNGTQIASTAVSTKTRQTLGLIFGSNWGERFDGRMDDMRIFNRALTASEVAALASQRGYNLPSNTRRRRYTGGYGL